MITSIFCGKTAILPKKDIVMYQKLLRCFLFCCKRYVF